MPAVVRQRDRLIGAGEPVLPRYERITFEKDLVAPPGRPPAAFVCPGHPLLEAVIDLTLERHRDLLRRGTVLVDERDPGDEPRVVFYLEHTIQDASRTPSGERRVISRRLLYVEIDAKGNIRHYHYAPYLDCRPLAPHEPDIETVLARPECAWFGAGAARAADQAPATTPEQAVLAYAVTRVVPAHLEEVRRRRLEWIEKARNAVKDRLTKEIAYWDRRAEELKLQEQAGKVNARLNSREARRRADEPAARLRKRLEQLDLEAQISALPPVVMGGFVVVLCRWSPGNQKVMNLFGRQAIPMVWDFAEANILGDSVGGWSTCTDYIAECIKVMIVSSTPPRLGHARLLDAAGPWDGLKNVLVSTDPPYYDNIGYAALSDFFYVWLRRTVGDLHPDLFATILVPKEPELVAAPERFGGDRDQAREHFETGFRRAFATLREKMDPRFPLTVYYAYKQADEESGRPDEEEADGNGNGNRVDRTTGWETMLEALISTGFQITATWPVRASQAWRMRAMGSNALASYIVLACRPRPAGAPQTDRRSFLAELKRELPAALKKLQQGNVAPVDFAQAAIGPGMAVYSRYRRILEASGRPMSVRTALALINQVLTEVLSEQEDEFDNDTRWAIAWFEQHGFAEGDFGEAELLSKAKATSVGGLAEAGLVRAKGGKVRLLRPEELPEKWDPSADRRLTVWEMTHHLLRVYYHQKAGDRATADLLRAFGSWGELARDLAYRLFNLAEKKNRSPEAQAYNALVLGWPEVARLARETPAPRQQSIFDDTEV